MKIRITTWYENKNHVHRNVKTILSTSDTRYCSFSTFIIKKMNDWTKKTMNGWSVWINGLFERPNGLTSCIFFHEWNEWKNMQRVRPFGLEKRPFIHKDLPFIVLSVQNHSWILKWMWNMNVFYLPGFNESWLCNLLEVHYDLYMTLLCIVLIINSFKKVVSSITGSWSS